MTGSAVTSVVLPVLVFERTGSAAATGGLFAVRVVPYLLFGLIAGPVADRGDRRRLIIGGNLAEGLLVATIPIAAAFGVLTIVQVYAVAALSATAFVFSDAAVFGAVPALVGSERIAAANGALAALASIAEIAGPVIAGVLIAVIGAASAVTVGAVSFFVAAALVASIRSSFRTEASPREHVRIRVQLHKTMEFVRSKPVIGVLFAAGFANSFAFGAVLGLLVPYASTVLGLARGSGLVGILYGAGGVGSLLAGLGFARLFRVDRVSWLTPASLAASGLAAATLSLTRNWVFAAAVLVVFSATITMTIMTGITFRQIASPDGLRSSVNVIGRMISWGGQPFGAAVGAVVATLADVEATYAAAAMVMLAAAVGARAALMRHSTRPEQALLE
jgi:MFS family permease